jgi:hypothetical protein
MRGVLEGLTLCVSDRDEERAWLTRLAERIRTTCEQSSRLSEEAGPLLVALVERVTRLERLSASFGPLFS